MLPKIISDYCKAWRFGGHGHRDKQKQDEIVTNLVSNIYITYSI